MRYITEDEIKSLIIRQAEQYGNQLRSLLFYHTETDSELEVPFWAYEMAVGMPLTAFLTLWHFYQHELIPEKYIVKILNDNKSARRFG